MEVEEVETRDGVCSLTVLAVKDRQGPMNILWGWFWWCLLLDEGEMGCMEGSGKDREMKSIEDRSETEY